MMQNLKYLIYREGLNVEVASFGSSIDEALSNLEVGEFMLGEFAVHA